MFYYILWFHFSLAYAVDISSHGEVGASFSEWISLLVSRGVYFLLAFLIALCFVITTVKNKLDERSQPLDQTASKDGVWSPTFWKGANSYFTLPSAQISQSPLEVNELEEMQDRLREAEVTVNSLKSELDHALKSRVELENTLESMERDKIGSEDELLRIKMDGALELEALRKESAITERQLKIALEEKEDLSREIECLKREGRITESALKDQQNLTERLERAREEIESLKNQMKGMKAERNMAVRLATDLMEKAKGIASRDSEQRQLIEEMIDAELRRVREDEEEENKLNELTQMNEEVNQNHQLNQNADDNEEQCSNECMGQESILHNDLGSLALAVGDGDAPISICRNLNDIYADPSGNDEQNSESRASSDASESSHSSLEDGDNCSAKRLVTSSPAFRAFFNSLGPRES